MPEGSAAIDVMIKAAELEDYNPNPKYRFTATYFGKDKDGIVLRFSINAISGIPDLKKGVKDENWYWQFLVKDGEDPLHPAPVGVSSYRINGPRSQPIEMIMRYTRWSPSKCP